MAIGIIVNIPILFIYFSKLSTEKFEEVESVAEIIHEDDVTFHRFSPATMLHLNCLPSLDLNDGIDGVIHCSSCKEYGRGDNLRNRPGISENEILLPTAVSSSSNFITQALNGEDRSIERWKDLMWNACVYLVMEDVPEEFASIILNFISRNRIGPHGVEIPGLLRPSQT